MKNPIDALIEFAEEAIEEAEAFVEGVADYTEEGAKHLRDAIESGMLHKALKYALTKLKAYPVTPDKFSIVVPAGIVGIKIVFGGIKDRINLLEASIEDLPETHAEIIDFFFTFLPTEIIFKDTIQAALPGVTGSMFEMGLDDLTFKGEDVKTMLHNIFD